MENNELYNMLNEYYKKVSIPNILNDENIDQIITRDLPKYTLNFKFLLEKLPFFLPLASKLATMETDVVYQEFQTVDLETTDKLVKKFLEFIDPSLTWVKTLEKLKEKGSLNLVTKENWMDKKYLDMDNSVTTNNGITIFLKGTIEDALQIIHELTHFLVVHKNSQIDYLFTEASAFLMTNEFIKFMNNTPFEEELNNWNELEKEDLFIKAMDFETVGTCLDVYLRYGKFNNKNFRKYAKFYEIEDLAYNMAHELNTYTNIDLERLFKNFRYIYAYPLAFNKLNEDFNIMDFLDSYLKAETIEEVATLFNTTYPLKTDEEVNELLKPLAKSGKQK